MGLFDKLESKLEHGVNGAFARAFKSEVQPVEIASGIRRAMDDRAASVGKGKRPIVPNLFTIELSPTDYDRLSGWGHDLDDELIASAQEHIDEQRYQAGGPLTIVLSEAETLETGVFRLRPATAKAADAIAHQRNHPRTRTRDAGQRDTDPRDPMPHARDVEHTGEHSTDEPSRTAVPGARLPGAGAASSAAAPVAGGRTFGTRMKDYLRGGTTPTDGARSQAHPDDDRRHLNDDRSYADDDRSYGSGYASADDYADSDGYEVDHHSGHGGHAHRDRDADGNRSGSDQYRSYADQYDGQEHDVDQRYRADEPYQRAGHDDAQDDEYERDAHRYDARDAVADEPYGQPEQARRHAWDDDSDGGDPTGYEPAPPAPQRHERRPMSPRERPWLKIDGQRYPLLGAITVLGRDDEADIVIDDPGVSRRHTEVRITHDGPHLVMSVRDLGSTNGTYVNGDRIDSMHVHDGDRLTLGRTPMTIHLGDRS